MSSSKTKKWLKRLGIGFGVFLLVFVGAALAIPYLFKDKILATAKSYINQNLNATVDFKDVSLSLLWTFPQFSFHLDGLTVTGKDEFEGMKLAEMQRFSVRLNLWSVIGGDYTVQGIVLDKPKLYVKVLNNGKANYDIAKADTAATKTDTSKTTEASGDFKVRLQYYAINNADVIYDDNSSNMYVELKNLTHSGSADFSASKYDLYTKTSIEAFTVVMDRISYLRKAKIAVDFNANVDMEAMKFILLKNSFKVNDLQLNAEGWLAMPKNDIDMDLKFSSPATSFAAVLSLIPGAYTKDFEGVKTGGSFSFAAFAKGIYNEKSMPAFGLDLNVANAHFQYPSLPMGVKDINTNVKINSPSSNLDQMTINVSKFQMLLGANPFSMRLNLKTPLSDPDVDAEVKGKIDLADLAKAFPMEGVKELSGLIEANLSTQTRLSYVSNAQYDKVKMDGALKISNMNYNAEGAVPTKIEVMQMDFSPNHVNLEQFKLKMGRSDVQAQGKLDNILTYFTRDKVMTGNLVVRSSFLDLNEIMGTDTSSSTDPQAATNMTDTTTAASTGEVFDRFKFGLDADFKRIIYDVYQLQDLKAVGSFSPTLAEMTQFDLLIGKVDMQAKGRLENVFGYLFDGELLKGDFSFNSNYMNLNQFMSSDGKATEPAPAPAPEDPSKAPAPYEPIVIPNNLDLRFTASMATLIYDTYKLRNVQTEILVRNQKAQIINLSCETMGGRMAFNGEYDTKDPVKPKFAFGYDLAKLEIVEVAKTAGIVQYFLPIAKSMTGRFDSKFKITGFLDKNLYPVLSSINSDGYLITYDAMLKGLALTKGLSEKVGAKDLETLVLTNTKNFFKIKDGKFELQPANFQYKDIDMILNGQHSLGGDGKYQMKMRIPKAMLQRSGTGAAVSNAAGAGFSALKGEASKLGVNLEQPDVQFVNVAVEMTGSLLQPKFAVKFLGAEGKGGESIGNQVGNTLKEEANKLKAEAEAKIKDAEDKARAEADRLKNEAEAKAKAEADRLKAEAEAKAKAEAQRLLQGNQPNLNNVVNKDSLKNKTQGTIQDAKDKLKVDPSKVKNPFKRN